MLHNEWWVMLWLGCYSEAFSDLVWKMHCFASVPAMLESETIPGLSGAVVKLVTSRKRAGSDPRSAGSLDGTSMPTVLKELGALYTALVRQELPSTLLEQAFRQVTHLLAACSLNSLMLRKDMCCWNRGLLIRSAIFNAENL